MNLIHHQANIFAHGSNEQKLKFILSLTCLSSLNAHIQSFVCDHSSCISTIFPLSSHRFVIHNSFKAKIPTGCLHIHPIPLFNSFPPIRLWITSYSYTSLLIDKTYIWYLGVYACADFEALETCQAVFFPQAGLPFETFCSVFPMTEQKKGLSSSAPTTPPYLPYLTSSLLFVNGDNQYICDHTVWQIIVLKDSFLSTLSWYQLLPIFTYIFKMREIVQYHFIRRKYTIINHHQLYQW